MDFSVLRWTWLSITILVGFAVSKFFFYLSVAYLMVESNSVAINLAVLSAGFYAIIVGSYLFGYEVMSGVIAFTLPELGNVKLDDHDCFIHSSMHYTFCRSYLSLEEWGCSP